MGTRVPSVLWKAHFYPRASPFVQLFPPQMIIYGVVEEEPGRSVGQNEDEHGDQTNSFLQQSNILQKRKEEQFQLFVNLIPTLPVCAAVPPFGTTTPGMIFPPVRRGCKKQKHWETRCSRQAVVGSCPSS